MVFLSSRLIHSTTIIHFYSTTATPFHRFVVTIIWYIYCLLIREFIPNQKLPTLLGLSLNSWKNSYVAIVMYPFFFAVQLVISTPSHHCCSMVAIVRPPELNGERTELSLLQRQMITRYLQSTKGTWMGTLALSLPPTCPTPWGECIACLSLIAMMSFLWEIKSEPSAFRLLSRVSYTLLMNGCGLHNKGQQ